MWPRESEGQYVAHKRKRHRLDESVEWGFASEDRLETELHALLKQIAAGQSFRGLPEHAT